MANRKKQLSYIKFQGKSLAEVKAFLSRLMNGGFDEEELFIGIPRESDTGYHIFINFTSDDGRCQE